MERKLVSIQRIASLTPIEGADFIELATILGWNAVVRKGEFQVGNLCAYFEVDSILPEQDVFEFMRPRRFRVKSMRLKGTLSQGLALPISSLNLNKMYLQEGDDVTKQLGVTKYDPADVNEPSARLGGKVKGTLPQFIRKTDEYRLQSYPKLFNEFAGLDIYQTIKLDGSSMTVYYNKNIPFPFGVCSRNLNLDKDETNAFWKVALNYDLEERFAALDENIYVQLELCGIGVQRNLLGLDALDAFAFNVFFLDKGVYGGKKELQEICKKLGLKTVPIEDEYVFNHTLDDLLKKAEGLYEGTKNQREGIVIRPVVSRLSPALGYSLCSAKIHNNEYLLREK
jgi:RNA ligase (TIGR02306 family)